MHCLLLRAHNRPRCEKDAESDRADAHSFAPPSRARLIGIGEEELLTVDLVTSDRLLSLLRDKPIDERLPKVLLDVGMLVGVDEHHAVLIEQALVALDKDLEVAAILECEPSAPIGEDVGVHR